MIIMHDHAAGRIAARNRKNDCKTLSLGRSGKFGRFLRLSRRCRRESFIEPLCMYMFLYFRLVCWLKHRSRRWFRFLA